jgi:hypothetical protein
MSGHLAAIPGIPLAMPQRVPDGYEVRGPIRSELKAGLAVMRAVTFSRAGRADDAVTICTEVPSTESCPELTDHVIRTAGGYRVLLAFSESFPSSDRADWTSVPLTLDGQLIETEVSAAD